MKRPELSAQGSSTTVMGDHLEPAERYPARAERRATRRGRGADALAWLMFGGLVVLIWQFTQMNLYTPQSDTGYWLGVSGGVLMLLLFAYPLRKRWPALARMGKAKHWFVVHMVLGIGGPIMIMAHCTFQIGSINAGAALFSMLVVAISGVAGRFIYLRIHRGLGGERLTFDALRQTLGFTSEDVRSQLHFAPQAEARLRALDKHAGKPGDTWAEHVQRLVVLPWLVRRERRACQRDTDHALAALAQERGWDKATLDTRVRRARRLVGDYTGSVLSVAQLSAYTRLFSLWHVLHVPFVVVMVLCAIAHIVAVHAY